MKTDIDYFLFYKHQNIAWGIKNFSFIVIPNGDVYTFNSKVIGVDILEGKTKNPTLVSHEVLNKVLDTGSLTKTNIPFQLDVKGLEVLPLEKDEAKMIWDAGYEVYSVFKNNPVVNTYESISLQIFDSYYFRAKKNKTYKEIINKIDFFKGIVKDKIETFPIKLPEEYSDKEYVEELLEKFMNRLKS